MADARYLIDIILRARDDTAEAFAKATGNAEGFKREMQESSRAVDEHSKKIKEGLGDQQKNWQKLNQEINQYSRGSREVLRANSQLEESALRLARVEGDLSKQRASDAQARAQAHSDFISASEGVRSEIGLRMRAEHGITALTREQSKELNKQTEDWAERAQKISLANARAQEQAKLLERISVNAEKLNKAYDVATIHKHEKAIKRDAEGLMRLGFSMKEVLKIQDDVFDTAKVEQFTAAQGRLNKEQIAYANAVERTARARRNETVVRADPRSSDVDFIRVSAETEEAQRELDLIAARAMAVGALSPTIKVEANVEGAMAKMAAVEGSVEGLGSKVKRLGREMNDEFNKSSGSIAAFDNLIRGFATLLITIFLQPLIVLAGAAGGALLALGSSALFAAGAIGGALTAGIAQAIPMLGILVAALARVKAVTDAVKQAGLLQEQQSYQGGQQAKRQIDTADQVRAAQDRIADAHRRVAEAQKNLTQAREDARRKLEDLILAERGATLSAKDAQKALAEAIREGRTGDIDSARLRVDETTLRRNRTRADLSQRRSRGVEGSPEVERAQEGLRDAQRAAVDAQRGLARARRGAADAEAGITAAAGKLNFLMANLSDAERKLFKAIQRLQEAWKSFSQFATEPLITAFSGAIGKITQMLGDDGIRQAARSLSESMAQSFGRIFDFLTSDEIVDQFLRIAEQGSENLKPLTDILISFSDIFLDIAEAAGPSLTRILKYFDALLVRFADFTSSTEGKNKMGEFFEEGTTHLMAWLKLFGAVGELFMAIAGPGGGAETGLTLVERMTKGINGLTEKIRQNPEGMRKFFAQTLAVLEVLWPILKQIGAAFQELFMSEAALNSFRAFGTIMNELLLPAFTMFVAAMGGLTRLFAELVKLPVVGELMKYGLAFALIAGTLSKLSVFIKPFIPLWRMLFGRPGDITRTARAFAILSAAIGRATASLGRLASAIPGVSRLSGALGGGAGLARTLLKGSAFTAVGVGIAEAVIAGFKSKEKSIAGKLGAGLQKAMKNFMPFEALTRQLGFDLGRTGKAADVFKSKIEKLAEKGDIAGLKEMREQLQKMGGKDSKDLVNSIDQILKASEKFAQRGGVRFNIQDMFGGTQAKKAVSAFIANLDEMRYAGISSVSDLRKNMRRNFDLIGLGIKEGTNSWHEAMTTNFGSGINAVKKAMADGTISTRDGMTEIRRIVRQQMRFSRDHMVDMSFEARSRLAANFAGARRAVEARVGDITKATGDGLKEVKRLMREELKLYGFSNDQISNYIQSRRDTSKQQSIYGGADEGAGGNREFKAGGGFIGMAGERGRDMIRTVLGRGEAVLNSAHQRYINPAVQAFYGHSLGETFNRVRGYHAGGPEQPGFAGGFAGRSPAGYRTVPIPGFPGEFIASRVLPDALSLIRKFKLLVTDAFATSGHKGRGHLHFGTAMDVVPNTRAGGSWNKVDAAVRYARSKGLTVLYNGVPLHGRGHHAHIELTRGAVGGGGGAFFASAGDASNAKISRLRIAGGADSPLRRIGEGAIEAVRRGAQDKMRSIIEKYGGGGADTSGDPGHAPEGALSRAEVTRIFRQAFDLALPYKKFRSMQPGWLGNLVNLASEESSWRPGAQNKTAAGLAAGLPQGILQVVGGTFRANALPGYTNVFNPLHNAIASIRYQLGRYQTIKRHAPYARGGVVGGDDPEGAPVPILAHAGEWVLNKIQQSKVASAMGVSRNKLRQYLGFSGGPSSYAGGGEIEATEGRRTIEALFGPFGPKAAAEERHKRRMEELERRRRLAELDEDKRKVARIKELEKQENELHKHRLEQLKEAQTAHEALVKRYELLDPRSRQRESIRQGIYTSPHTGPAEATFGTINTEVRRVFDAIRNIRRNKLPFALRRFSVNIDALTTDGGLFDQMSDAIERMSTRMTADLDLARAGLRRVFRGGGRGRIVEGPVLSDPEAIIDRESAGLAAAGARQRRLRERADQALQGVDRRILNLRRGGVTETEREDYEKLVAQRVNLAERIDTLDGEIAQNAIDRFEKVQEKFEAGAAEALRPSRLRGQALDVAARIAQALGNTDALQAIGNQQLANLQGQRVVLAEKAREAANLAATDPRWREISDRFTEELGQLDSQIVESIAARLTNLVAAADTAAQRSMTSLDLRGRRAEIADRMGDRVGAARARQTIESERAGVMRNQLSALGTLFGQAVQGGNVGVAQELSDRMEELRVQIEESEATQRDLVVATRQVSIDMIQQRSSFRSGVFGGLRGIVESLGKVSGQVDTNAIRGLVQQTITTLQTAGAGLMTQLVEGFGIDLRGLSGMDLVNRIASLDFDALTAGMTQAERDQFEALINAVIENTGAQLDNTDQLQELTGGLAPQTFSSSAWTMFRSAIFNGMGGLLPQYEIPQMHTGGLVTQGGLFELQAGEFVIKQDRVGASGDVHLHIDHPTEVADPLYLGKRIGFELGLERANSR